ncbi:MAG TPA: hypothetical protein VJZ00_05930, partial [Thermoanaerobaculia bacterium]|nr:hypothetical protein [Thermoanaerobaculia bacterium]
MRKLFGCAIPIAISAVLYGVFVIVPMRNQRRQLRTLADMRTLGAALEAYATDHKSYSVDAFRGPNSVHAAAEFDKLHVVRIVDLERALSPTYLEKLPRNDRWGNPFDVRTGGYDKDGRAAFYAIRSAGQDRLFERGPYQLTRVSSLDSDL